MLMLLFWSQGIVREDAVTRMRCQLPVYGLPKVYKLTSALHLFTVVTNTTRCL